MFSFMFSCLTVPMHLCSFFFFLGLRVSQEAIHVHITCLFGHPHLRASNCFHLARIPLSWHAPGSCPQTSNHSTIHQPWLCTRHSLLNHNLVGHAQLTDDVGCCVHSRFLVLIYRAMRLAQQFFSILYMQLLSCLGESRLWRSMMTIHFRFNHQTLHDVSSIFTTSSIHHTSTLGLSWSPLHYTSHPSQITFQDLSYQRWATLPNLTVRILC